VIIDVTPMECLFPFKDQDEADRWFVKYVCGPVIRNFEKNKDAIMSVQHDMTRVILAKRGVFVITEDEYNSAVKELLMMNLGFMACVETLRSPLIGKDDDEAWRIASNDYGLCAITFMTHLVRLFGNGALILPESFPFTDEAMQYELDSQKDMAAK